jgi:cytochrome P450
MLSHSSVYLVLATVGLLLLSSVIRSYYRLSQIPGPLLAKCTDLWRLLKVKRGDSHDTFVALHEQYGDFVRIGPNCVLISKPDAIPMIYGIQKGFVKSDFYTVWQNMVNGKRVASMVFATDEQQHAAMRRPIAQAYSLSSLVGYEPLVDSTTAVFLSRLDELFASKEDKVCDLGLWLGWYAFDVIGELTFSKRLGFLEKAQDVEGIAKSILQNFEWCAALGQMPWLEWWTRRNPIYQRLFAGPTSSPIIKFGQRRMQERLDEGEGSKDETTSDPTTTGASISDPELSEKVLHGTLPNKPDFLSRFLELHEEQPEVVDQRRLLAYLFMNINAGSDTISATARGLIYHALKHPDTLQTLRDELDAASSAGDLTSPLPTWNECQQLPYLNACIKEALRLSPALALPLERIVPPSGLRIGDTAIPPGTIVGINPWVLHRDKRIFGQDADEWNPSRWLVDDTEKVKYMEKHLLSFGAGTRTCLGRHIAMLELSKMIPALILRYDMRLSDPKKEWKVTSAFAVKQEGWEVIITRRD